MKTKVPVVSALAIIAAFSAVFFAQAQQNSTVTTSGVLEAEKVAVSIPVGLAVIGADPTKQAKPGATRGPQKPVGTIAKLNIEPGDLVKRGDVVAMLDDRMARQNLAKAQAQFDQVVATIGNLQGTRTDLQSNKNKLGQTEADLQAKRVQVQSNFASKYAQGQTKIAQLERQLATLRSGLAQAESGLASIREAKSQAELALAVAQALPDNDPTKAQRVNQAQGALQGLARKEASLNATVRQLKSGESQLAQGIAKANQGLDAGKQQFDAGITKMNDALTKINKGRTKSSGGQTKISKKLLILLRRRDQAEVAVSMAQKILDSTKIHAQSDGRAQNIRVDEGSVVYPGQAIMSIGRADTLKLSIYVPLHDVARVKKGDTVDVKIDGELNRIFKGTVTGVGAEAVFAPSNMTTSDLELVRVVRVSVQVENQNDILKAGLPADISIH
ncbi:MAG TPA: HlyD family efflux transporter periplasmic adaptor subunit [Candidatus Aquicultor sp.]|jgi:multidrug resistance efflux pump